MALKCPVCGLALGRKQKQFVCASMHSFDEAKEGYVNLHLAQDKKSKHPGDDQAMLVSRRSFLEKSYYDKLAFGLCDIISTYVEDHAFDSTTFLDIGCGEGYFTAKITSVLKTLGSSESCGIDIAKTAVKMAAKRHRCCLFMVASNYKLPFFDSQFNIILSINAPVDYPEIQRLLDERGIYLHVRPGPKHLYELKKWIYSNPQIHEQDIQVPDGLNEIQRILVTDPIDIQGADNVFNLLQMTPYYWAADRMTQRKLAAQSSLQTMMEFDVRVFSKRAL